MLFDRYRKIRELGRGNTSVVILYYDTYLLREVAVKISDKKEILKQEGRVAASLSASFFPEIYDYKEQGQYAYLFLEFFDGETIKERMNRVHLFTFAEIIYLSLTISKVIAFLHKQDPPFIYGDLKPDNVMITKQGEIKLIDFGTTLTKKMKSSVRGGTKYYAAPEHFIDHPDVRNDIFSFGKMMEELIQYHYKEATSQGKGNEKKNIMSKTKKEISQEIYFYDIIKKCIQHDPNLRYQTMEEVSTQLEVLS